MEQGSDKGEQLRFYDARGSVGQMVDAICTETLGLTQVLDHSRVEDTKLRVRWDDTMVEVEEGVRLKELTEKYGIE